jgi:hypothetical protein
MDEQQKAERPLDDTRPKTAMRRPWHAPQFLQTEVASTYVQNNGGHDGAGFAPSLS